MKIADALTHDTWCQVYGALNAEGVPVATTDPTACRRCILGFIDYCYPPQKRRPVEDKLLEHIYGFKRKGIVRKLGQCLSVWNDTRPYAEIRKVVVECNV